jgi:hypothetical protein
MTARGIFPKSGQMTLQTLTVVCVILIAAILAAGCEWQTGDRTHGGTMTLNVTATATIPSPISTAMPIESPMANLSYYWIRMDPVGEKMANEKFTITSTTNLPAGEEVLIGVFLSYPSHQKIRPDEPSAAMGRVKVHQGSDGINTLSFTIDTQNFEPCEYEVTETAVLKEGSGTGLFYLFPDPLLHGNATLKPINFINWEKLNLTPLKVNTSIKPEFSPGKLSLSRIVQQKGQIWYGSIIVFAPDNIVRCFDRNGTHYATYFGFRSVRFVYPPTASAVYEGPIENVTTITDGNERILTEIYEVPINY